MQPDAAARPRIPSATAHAAPQLAENLQLSVFSCEVDKPMMEMRAGSNRWYQAHVVAESQNEVQVIFPAIDKHAEASMEWVSKRSSRIWRGSLAGEVWKYLSNGAWAPKAANAAKQQMSRKTSGGRRRKRQATAEPSDSGLASTDAPDSTQLASGYDNTSSPDASGVERRRSQRRRVAVSRGDEADEAEVSPPAESRPEAEPAFRHRKTQRRATSTPDDGETHAEALVRWFQQHVQALGTSLGPAPACCEAGAVPSHSAPDQKLPGPLEGWSSSLPIRLLHASSSPGQRVPEKGTRDMESSSESDQRRRKSADLPTGSTALPAPSEGMAATDYGHVQGKGSNGLRSAWAWHSQGRPAALTSGSEDCHINNAGLMSRSGSMSSLPHARKEEGPDWGADLSSKSTSTPAGLIPPKASDKHTTVSLILKAPALRTT